MSILGFRPPDVRLRTPPLTTVQRRARWADSVRFDKGRGNFLCRRGSRVRVDFTAATERTSCLSFGAPVYVYVEAAQPELGMLIVGDVDAALAALHRGDLGAFRFQKNHRERAEWTQALYALTRAKFDPNPDKIETARSALRSLAAASGALVTVQHRRSRERRKR
jgi:hypothetical protein